MKKVCIGLLAALIFSGCTLKDGSNSTIKSSTPISEDVSKQDFDNKLLVITLDYLSDENSKSEITDDIVELGELKNNSIQLTVSGASQDYWTSIYIDNELVSGPSKGINFEYGVSFNESGSVNEAMLEVGQHSIVAAQYETQKKFYTFSEKQAINFSKYNYTVLK